MLRSLSVCIILARQHLSSHDTKRVLQKFQPVLSQYAAVRPLQTTACRFSENDKKSAKGKGGKVKKGEERDEGKRKTMVNEEMKQAVVKVAKSLPGDWTKTAEELLARLKMHEKPEAQKEDVVPEEEGLKKSLLSTMGIARSFQHERKMRTQKRRGGQPAAYEELPSSSSEPVARPRRMARKREIFTQLYGVPRLGIFDADKLKKEAAEVPEESSEPEDLWHQVDRENLRQALGGVPRNAFEEMVQWTKEGKLWKFPIDNEADMHEERKYKFHDHVFLEQHLTEFPDKGPIRKFMELVTLGLGMNPYISVPEKVEHIKWFAEYFREKQDVIEAAVGEEQGRMKSKGGELE